MTFNSPILSMKSIKKIYFGLKFLIAFIRYTIILTLL